jgi:NAD(P)-dependent dehydrogenase (short-subunit alcohol dehydrogenase family)
MTGSGRALEGKVALVSGASRGVGRTYALALAEAGANVIALARSLEGEPTRLGSLTEVVATARQSGLQVAALACDLRDEANIAEVVQQAVASLGGVDILVNNAVWTIRGFNPLAVPKDDWDGAMRVNVRGTYVFMREVVPHMLARGGGSIINITSGSAGVTARGSGAHDGFLAYGVSKAALERLTTYFAAEFADRNIAVNAISPGHVSRYLESRREPDRAFWGEPIVHLGMQRPPDGLTGRILHTYGYGRAWGPTPPTPPLWDPDIVAILRDAGITD